MSILKAVATIAAGAVVTATTINARDNDYQNFSDVVNSNRSVQDSHQQEINENTAKLFMDIDSRILNLEYLELKEEKKEELGGGGISWITLGVGVGVGVFLKSLNRS